MTQDFGFALRGEDEDHEDEWLWAPCESAENLFADPPAPVRTRYGEARGKWYLEDAQDRPLGH
ncbi:hypothetical protein [Streptomyces sp. NPDC096339]|uniref:hypothetical protein n=1 Tax=Streptomyces sp. NPDC096339 TaxID=3366086 RepID=UPI0038051F78